MNYGIDATIDCLDESDMAASSRFFSPASPLAASSSGDARGHCSTLRDRRKYFSSNSVNLLTMVRRMVVAVEMVLELGAVIVVVAGVVAITVRMLLVLAGHVFVMGLLVIGQVSILLCNRW